MLFRSGILFGAYGTAGQRCTTTRRVIAHESIHDALVERLDRARAQLPIGSPIEPGTLIGPLIDAQAFEAMQAALADTGFLPAYVAAVADSRTRLYAACDRLGIEYWTSAANFVLMRVGPRAPEVVAHLAAAGVHVRDRSRDPYSPGCIRVTAGVTAHTDRKSTRLNSSHSQQSRMPSSA